MNISLIVVLLFFTQIDDELNTDANTLLSRLDSSVSSQAYPYLLGFFANNKEDPRDVGQAIIDDYNRLQANDLYEAIEYQKTKRIVRPVGELFCKAWEKGCLESLFSANIDIAKLYSDHHVLLDRSNRFMAFTEYSTLLKPTIATPAPPFQYLLAAERIKVLGAISSYKNGNSQEAIDSLYIQFYLLKKSLALQDNLIGKIVFLAKLSELIDVISVILSQEVLEAELIHSLSQSEKSFSRVAAREFSMLYHLFTDLDKSPDFFRMGENSPGWIVRAVYKPNMTLNALTPKFINLQHLALLPAGDFAKEIEKGRGVEVSSSTYRNYAGGVLVSMSGNLEEYVARFKDFDAKLELFNHLYHYRRGLLDVKNPYYADETAIVSLGRACFRGPLEDKKGLRCLLLKI